MSTIELPMLEPIRLSNSKAKTYRRCPKQFEFKYVMKVKRKRHSLPLKRGDWLHQLMMVHYDGEDWRIRHRELTAKFNELFEEEREELGDLPAECERIFKSYLANYRHEDKGWNVIETEIDETVELPNGDVFQFIIDLIIEEADGGIWLADHKTVKGFMPQDFMLLDAQLTRYFWAAQKKLGIKVRGVLFNELITAPPTIPALLKNGTLTKKKNLRCDVYTYFRTIKELGLDVNDYRDVLARLKLQNDRWFRRTRLPRDAGMVKQQMRELMMTSKEIKLAVADDHFPRTPDKSCQWGCDYLDPCMIQLAGGDISSVLKMNYTTTKREED